VCVCVCVCVCVQTSLYEWIQERPEYHRNLREFLGKEVDN